MLTDGCTLKLVIQQVAVEDEGTYSIMVGEHTSKAKLMVEGKLNRELKTFKPSLLQLSKLLSVVTCDGFNG